MRKQDALDVERALWNALRMRWAGDNKDQATLAGELKAALEIMRNEITFSEGAKAPSPHANHTPGVDDIYCGGVK